MRILLLLILLFLPGFLLQTILLATKTGADQVVVSSDGFKVFTLVNFEPGGPPFTSDELENVMHGTSAIDFNKASGEIFIVSGRKLQRLTYDIVTKNYISFLLDVEMNVLITDVAVDWEEKRVYVGCAKRIFELNYKTSTSQAIILRGRNVSSVEFDPYTRKLFYLEESKKLMQHVIGGLYSIDVMVTSGFPYEIIEMFEIAVDVPKQTIYAILSYVDGGSTHRRCMIRMYYKTFQYKMVYEGSELSNVAGLDVFSDEVFWGNYHNRTYILYKGRMSTGGQLANVTVVYKTKEEIRGLKVDHPDSQKPTILNLCTKLRCSHGCKKSSNMKYLMGIVCTCPEDMMLDSDGKTCTGYFLQTYLLATDTGIEELIVTDNGSTTSTVVNLTQGASAFDFHRAKYEIYILSENKILRASYYPRMVEPSVPTQVPASCQSLADLTFDWENGDIRYICTNPSEMININLFGSELKETSNSFSATKGAPVRIDPYARTLFFIHESKWMMQYVIGDSYASDIMTISGFFHKITEVSKFALDVPKQIVYVIVTYVENNTTHDRCLIRVNYNPLEFKMIDTGPELSNVVGLDVFNDEMVWSKHHNLTYTLYRGRMSSEGQLENVTGIHRTEQEIRHVRIYHRDSQTPSTLNLCLMGKCSHSCKGVNKSISPHGVLCTCPIDMLLDADGRTCRVLEHTTTPLPPTTIDPSPSGHVEEKQTPKRTGSYASSIVPVVCSVALLLGFVKFMRKLVVKFF